MGILIPVASGIQDIPVFHLLEQFVDEKRVSKIEHGLQLRTAIILKL